MDDYINHGAPGEFRPLSDFHHVPLMRLVLCQARYGADNKNQPQMASGKLSIHFQAYETTNGKVLLLLYLRMQRIMGNAAQKSDHSSSASYAWLSILLLHIKFISCTQFLFNWSKIQLNVLRVLKRLNGFHNTHYQPWPSDFPRVIVS